MVPGPGAKGEQLSVCKKVDVVRGVDGLRDPVYLVRDWSASGIGSITKIDRLTRHPSAKLGVVLYIVYAGLVSLRGR